MAGYSPKANAYQSAYKRGLIVGEDRSMMCRAKAGHQDTCCARIMYQWEIAPWDWDENNNRVCAKCGESLEGRFK